MVKPSEWLRKQLEKLKMYTDELCKASNVHYEVHAWTPLKLITLMYWVDIYTRIISKQKKYAENYWYLDLLAGSGTNFIKEVNTVVIGSPFIAILLAQKPFTRYVFIELDHEKAKALRKRVEFLKKRGLIHDKVLVYEDDCNNIIQELPIEKASHFLAFIDCEGLDVNWNTYERLLEKRGDLIIVFQTQSLNRTLGRAKHHLGDERKMTMFMGDESWREACNAEELLNIFMNKLREYRSYVDCVRIRGRYRYDIILACKQGPYTSAWEYLKERYLSLTDKDAKLALRILRGELKALDEFFETKRPKQITLNEFFFTLTKTIS